MIRTIVLSALLACAGCVGSVLESKREDPELYRLTTPEIAAGAGETLTAALTVHLPHAPLSIDTERIAVVGPATRFDYYAGVRWAEPVPLMLQHLLVQALAADGRFTTVVAEPSSVPSEYELELELRRFEAANEGNGPPVVQIAVQVTLLDTRRGTRLASFPATASVAAQGDRRADVMTAFDAATHQVIASIVAATRSAAPAPAG